MDNIQGGFVNLYGCPICGVKVGPPDVRVDDRNLQWLHEYRVLYLDGTNDLMLSEECCYLNDEPDDFYSLNSDAETQSWTDMVGVMNQPAYNNRRGFVFHSNCWSLLSVAHGPSPVSLQRMFDICSSLPIIDNIPSWGHGYQGLLEFCDLSSDPWSPELAQAFKDPKLSSVDIDPIVQQATGLVPPAPDLPPDAPRRPESQPLDSHDLFSRLPAELLFAIVEHLQIADFLNARLATRAFWPLFHDQSFWKARFGPESERAWLFETWKASYHSWIFKTFCPSDRCWFLERGVFDPQDWRSLYRQTSKSRLPFEFRNRVRVWELASAILPIINLLPGPRRGMDSIVLDSMALDTSSVTWQVATAHIKRDVERAMRTGDAYTFPHGCRELYESGTVVMPSLCQFTFYFVDVAGSRFLAGLRTIEKTGHSCLMGYESPIAMDFRLPALGHLFRGFAVAVEPRGVTAIRVHCVNKKEPSEWYGDEATAVKMIQAVTPGVVTMIEAGFDGFKVVSVAIS